MANYNSVHGVIEAYLTKNSWPQSMYFPLMAHAMTWLNQRNRTLAPDRATVEIMLQNDRTAALPDDFVDWLVVGRQMGSYVENFAFNQKVTALAPVMAPGTAAPTPQLSADPWCCNYGGWIGGALQGWGRGAYPPEEFVIDLATRTLRTNSEVPEGALYLHYIFNSEKPNVRTPLHPDHCLLLEYFIEWQANRRAPDSPKLKKEYFDELLRVARLRDPFTAESAYDIFNNTTYGDQ